MKSATISLLAVAILLGSAASASAQRKTAGCGPDVALNVTIFGTRGAPSGYGLVSDGSGGSADYLYLAKGPDKVVSIFQVDNCTHDFTLNLHASTRSMFALLSSGDVRAGFFNFDRVHSVPVTTNQAAFDAYCAAGVVRNADGSIATSNGQYLDNYAGCGSDVHGNYVRRHGSMSLDGDQQLAYQTSPIDRPAQSCDVNPANPACGAAFLRVYHPDANTWIVRTEMTDAGTGLGPQALASHRVWESGSYVFKGYQNIPFEIVAKRKP